MRILTVLFLFILAGAHAQTAGDYRTKASGSWLNPTIWERYNGSVWQDANSAPSSSDGVILLRSGHSVVVPSLASVNVDQLILAGSLTVEPTGTLNVMNGSDTDILIVNAEAILTVNGTLVRQNLSEIGNPFTEENIIFGPGANYIHRYTTSFGNMPAATWDPGSRVTFTNFANTTAIAANSTWDQSFGSVLFNNHSQRAVIDLQGNFKRIQGNLTVTSTGNNILVLSGSQNLNLEIGTEGNESTGDLTVSGSARLYFGQSGNVSVDILGDLNYSSSNSGGSYFTVSGSTTVNLYGTFNMTAGGGGKIRMAGSPGAIGTLNLFGDFNLNAGQIDEAGSGTSQGRINFVKNGTQQFVSNGTLGGYLRYSVGPSTVLNVGTYSLGGGSTSYFTLNGTIILGSTDPSGAISAGPASNIKTKTNSFQPGSTVVYQSNSPQYLGSGHPSAAGVTTVINNSAGVRLSSHTSIGGTLVLQSGTLNLNDFDLTISGDLENAGGMLGATEDSRLLIRGDGSGQFGELVFDPEQNVLGTLSISRTGQDVVIPCLQPFTITSVLNIVNGTLDNQNAITLRDGVSVTRYENGFVSGTQFNVEPGGRYNLYYRTQTPNSGPYSSIVSGLEISNDPNLLNNFTVLTAQNSDEVHLSADVTVNGTFTLTKGRLYTDDANIIMAGPAWNDNNGVLVPGTGYVIFKAETEVAGSANPVFGNIQVLSEAQVNFTRSLNFEGQINFEPGSSVNFNNVTVTFSGNQPQSVSVNGATLPNLTIAKAEGQGVLLLSTLNLTGIMQFVSPARDVNFQSNGHLHLISTSDESGNGTARIYRIASGNRISGDVVVNRFMSAEGQLYRYISSPVSNATVAQLKDNFFVGGKFLDPSPKTQLCGVTADPKSPTLYYYDETAPGAIDNGYVAYPSSGKSAAASPLGVGRGYAAFMRHCDEPVIIDYVGPINQGTLTLPVTYRLSDPIGDGWNLVGNPYPATIDWDNGWTKTRISPLISIMDNASGMMRYYDPGVTNEIPNGHIAMGQAFWVLATGANPTLRITENAKVTGVAEFFREAAPQVPNFVLSLSDGAKEDYAYVKIVPNARLERDEFDGPKIKNLNAYSLSTVTPDKVSMAINAVEELYCGLEFPLRVDSLRQGRYSFRIDTRGNFPEFEFVLTDRYADTDFLLGQAEYLFTVTDSLSASYDRFVVRVREKSNFSPVTVVATTGCDDKISVDFHGAETNVQYSVWSASGVQISAIERASASNFTLSFPAASHSLDDLVVRAHAACGSLVQVSQPFDVSSTIPELKLMARYSCVDGQVELVANIDDDQVIVHWYKSEQDVTPVFTGTVFEVDAAAKKRTYFAEVVNRSGCKSDRKAISTDVVPMEPVSLVLSGQKLETNYTSDNAWFYEGTLIAENTASVVADRIGEYSISVKVGGCMKVVTHYQEFLPELQFFPNPVADKLTVFNISDDIREIYLMNTLGVRVKTVYQKGEVFGGEVDVQALSDGIYFLTVITPSGRTSYRIVKGVEK